jgi:hypothetical protein
MPPKKKHKKRSRRKKLKTQVKLLEMKNTVSNENLGGGD